MRSPLNLEEKTFDLQEWAKTCQDKLDRVMVLVPEKRESKVLSIPAQNMLTALPLGTLAGIPDFEIPQKDEIIPSHFVMLSFFGTVFVGFDTIPDARWKEHLISDLHLTHAPAFRCPSHWTLAKILGALKVFSSVGDAKRNGWDKQSPEGWEDHKVRVAKMQGILTVVTPTQAVLSPTSWDAILLTEDP